MRITDLTPATAGRAYLCIGPHCWGKGQTAAEAIKNAKREKPSWLGAPKWGYILYDVQDDARIDGMGDIVYTPREGVEPYREVLRHNVPKRD